MSKTDQLRDEIKRANPDKKLAEELDKMRPDEIDAMYILLRAKGRMRK